MITKDSKKKSNLSPEISNYFSEMAKKSHKKNPRDKAFYSEIGKKGAKKRWGVDNSDKHSDK